MRRSTVQGSVLLSSSGAILSGIAGRYAAAVFDLAKNAKALDLVESDFGLLAGLLEGSQDFRTLVASPILSRADQMKAVKAIAAKIELQSLTANFLGVLAQNGRLKYLESSLEAFAGILADDRGEVKAEVVSAYPLSDDQLSALNANVKESVGREVALEATDDPSLLGGMIVKVGSKMVDSSIRTKLENLKVSMKGL